MHVAYSVIINGRAIERKAHITAETDTAREKIEAIEWGSRGRWFKSSHSDQKVRRIGRKADSPYFLFCRLT